MREADPATTSPAAEPKPGRIAGVRAFLLHPVTGTPQRALLVAAFASLIALRFPQVLEHGRFWAEEGSVFYANAWTMPWWRALLATHSGYLNLIANAAGLLAYLAPIKAAPYVSSTVALLVYCCAASLVVFARDDWLQMRIVVLAALLLIATPPGTDEVWLNSINSQFIVIVCVGLVLALAPAKGGLGVLQACILVIAPLSSPGSWCLLPLFGLRAVLEGSRERWLQGAMMLPGLLLQMLFFFTPAQRSFGIDPLLLNAAILAKHVLLPWLGHNLAAEPIEGVRIFLAQSRYPWLLFAVIPALLAIGAITATRPRQPALWFFLAAAATAAVGYIAADGKPFLISVLGASRYAYAPQVLFGLSLLAWGSTQAGATAIAARILVAWLLLVGAYGYFRPSAEIFASGPNWSKEVNRWQREPKYRLGIWPRGWTMRLPAPKTGP
jgi:hypothetical protein